MDGFICILTCHQGCVYRVGRLERRLGWGVALDPPPGLGLSGGSGHSGAAGGDGARGEGVAPQPNSHFTSAATFGFKLFLPVER